MTNGKNKRLMLLISVINAILILLSAAGCIYVCFSGNGVYYSVTAATELLALAFSAAYFTFGYQKNATKYTDKAMRGTK